MIGDIEDLPFVDDGFDAIMSNCVINHAKDKSRVYLEITRILEDRGRFEASDTVIRFDIWTSI